MVESKDMFEFREARIVSGNKGAGDGIMGRLRVTWWHGKFVWLWGIEGEEGLCAIDGVSVEVIKMAADSLFLEGQREGDGFGGWRIAATEMEVLLEVGEFDVDGGVEMTMIQALTDILKRDLEWHTSS